MIPEATERSRRVGAVLAVLLLGACGGPGEPPEPRGAPAVADDSRTAERSAMVDRQIAARGIADPAVLAAMRAVPRHRFVPAEMAPYAYQDSALPIGEEQTISQPFIVAYMTETLCLDRDAKVLEVGTGSGYQAAVLGEIAGEVHTIEILPGLAERARRTLEEMGYRNVRVHVGDGYRGLPEEAPFDAIMVTAAPDHVPQPLLDQLKVGGRMVIPVGRVVQELVLLEKTATGIVRRSVLDVTFVPMTGEAEKP